MSDQDIAQLNHITMPSMSCQLRILQQWSVHMVCLKLRSGSKLSNQLTKMQTILNL